MIHTFFPPIEKPELFHVENRKSKMPIGQISVFSFQINSLDMSLLYHEIVWNQSHKLERHSFLMQYHQLKASVVQNSKLVSQNPCHDPAPKDFLEVSHWQLKAQVAKLKSRRRWLQNFPRQGPQVPPLLSLPSGKLPLQQLVYLSLNIFSLFPLWIQCNGAEMHVQVKGKIDTLAAFQQFLLSQILTYFPPQVI